MSSSEQVVLPGISHLEVNIQSSLLSDAPKFDLDAYIANYVGKLVGFRYFHID